MTLDPVASQISIGPNQNESNQQQSSGPFCPHCGARRNPSITNCEACGKDPFVSGTRLSSTGVDLAGQARSAIRDLWDVLSTIGRNPINGIATAHAELSQQARIRTVAALLILLSVLSIVVGISVGLDRWSLGPFSAGGTDLPVLALFVGFIAFPAALVLISHLLRRLLLRSQPDFDVDLFATAVSLVPFALAMLGAGLVGIGNAEIAVFLLFYGLVLMTLMLFTAWTDTGGIGKAPAAWSIPFAIVVAAWICKVAVVAILT